MFAMSHVTPVGLLSILVTLGACMNGDITSSSSASFPIQITILSSNGTDLSSSMPILHSHIPLSTLHKRSTTSVTMQGCPLGYTYTSHSWCHHDISPQKFETFCMDPPQQGRTTPQEITHISQGQCANDEICVGSNAGDMRIPREAYCVSTNHFVPIGRTPSSGSGDGQDLTSSGVVTAGFNPSLYIYNGSNLAIEAVVTYVNKQTSLFAASAVMQAQTYNGAWRTVANGQNYCVRCSSVSLAPFPATAQRVKVDVVMPEGTSTGLLWLASYPY